MKTTVLRFVAVIATGTMSTPASLTAVAQPLPNAAIGEFSAACPSDPVALAAMSQEAAICLLTKCAQDCASRLHGDAHSIANGVLDLEESFCPLINCCNECSDAARQLYFCANELLCEEQQDLPDFEIAGCDLECSKDRFPMGPSVVADDNAAGRELPRTEPIDHEELSHECPSHRDVANCFREYSYSCNSCALVNSNVQDSGGDIGLQELLCPSVTCCSECASLVQAYYQCHLPNTISANGIPETLQCHDDGVLPPPTRDDYTYDGPCTAADLHLYACIVEANCDDCFDRRLQEGDDRSRPPSCGEFEYLFHALDTCCPACQSELHDAARCQLTDGDLKEHGCQSPLYLDGGRGFRTSSVAPIISPHSPDADRHYPCDVVDEIMHSCFYRANCVSCFEEDTEERPTSCVEFDYVFPSLNACCPDCESELHDAARCLLTEGDLKEQGCESPLNFDEGSVNGTSSAAPVASPPTPTEDNGPCAVAANRLYACFDGANCNSCLDHQHEDKDTETPLPPCVEFEYIFQTLNACCPDCEPEVREAARCALTDGDFKEQACNSALNLVDSDRIPSLVPIMSPSTQDIDNIIDDIAEDTRNNGGDKSSSLSFSFSFSFAYT